MAAEGFDGPTTEGFDGPPGSAPKSAWVRTASGLPPVHIASSPVGGRQYCRRCGAVLIDNTRVDAPRKGGPPAFFGTGALVQALAGGGLMLSDDDDGRPCLSVRGESPCL